MKSLSVPRKRREATRIEWTPSGSVQSNASAWKLHNTSNLVSSTSFMPADATDLQFIPLIRLAFAIVDSPNSRYKRIRHIFTTKLSAMVFCS
jgi:hypothetical protein